MTSVLGHGGHRGSGWGGENTIARKKEQKEHAKRVWLVIILLTQSCCFDYA